MRQILFWVIAVGWVLGACWNKPVAGFFTVLCAVAVSYVARQTS